MDMTLNRIQLEIFEGPLDLLLHLIQKNELDITTVSLTEITAQYLDYLELMQELNIEFASEFLVMAAELARLKSRSLLPQVEEEEPDDEELPDEKELLRRLLRYQQFRRAAEALSKRPQLGVDLFSRSATATLFADLLPDEVPIRQEEPGKLVFFYRTLLAERGEARRHHVMMEKISVRQKMVELLDFLHEQKTATLRSLIGRAKTRAEKIGAFLAVLELVRMKLLELLRGGDNDWELARNDGNGESVDRYQDDFQ